MSASVTLVYQHGATDEETHFMRSVMPDGNSVYRINGKHVTHAVYNSRLEDLSILVKVGLGEKKGECGDCGRSSWLNWWQGEGGCV